MKRTSLVALAASGIALSLCSCFDQQETITIKPDGSGTVVERIEIKSAEMWQMASAQTEGGPLDEAQYQAAAGQMGEGVTFQGVEKFETEGGGGGIVVTFAFVNADTLQLVDTLGAGGAAGAAEGEPSFTFDLQGNQLTVTNNAMERAKDAPAEATPEDAQAAEMQKQMMAAMGEALKGAHLQRSLVIEGGIGETNASFVEGNTITLIDLPFDNLMSQENWSELLEEEPDTAEEVQALNAIEGIKVEPAAQLTVTLGQ